MVFESEIISYFFDYGVGKAIDCAMERFSRKGEKTIEEHAYEVLEDSLAIFCSECGIETNTTAFREMLCLRDTETKLINRQFLRNVLINVTGLDITSDQWNVWCDIVFSQIVSDKHEKLYRAIHFRRMCSRDLNLIEPDWVRVALEGNAIDIAPFEGALINKLAVDIKTSLTEICWRNTLELLDELIMNATVHGHAQDVSLLIEESRLTVCDDGAAFDIRTLKATTCGQGGGRDTLIDFESKYPDVLIDYTFVNNRNVVVIAFPEKVFNVNGLCEVSMKEKYMKYRFDIIERFEQGKARYYYIDFGKFGLNYFSRSMAGSYVHSLYDFAVKKDAVVFVGIPDGNSNHSWSAETWDDIAMKINRALYFFEKRHMVVCRY